MGKRLYSDEREVFRVLIKQVRLDAGLTQVDVAKKLGRRQSFVSDYELGNRRLDWVAVTEVLAACNHDLIQFSKAYLAEVRPKK